MIDVSSKFVLVHPPRCGGTTIEAALLGTDMWSVAPSAKHWNRWQIAQELDKMGLDSSSMQWLGLKRNPAHRLVSMWNRGYWSNSWPYSLFSVDSMVLFCALVQPEGHEHKNLSLVDFHGKDPEYQVVDISQIDCYMSREWGIVNLERQQVTNSKFSMSIWAAAVAEYRFSNDYKWFGYQKTRPFGPLSGFVGCVLFSGIVVVGQFLVGLRMVKLKVNKWFD